MVKTPVVSAAVAAIALAVTANNNAQAFQLSRPVALSPSVKRTNTSFGHITDAGTNRSHQTSISNVNMMNIGSRRSEASSSLPSNRNYSLFQSTSQRTRRTLQKLRRSFTVLLASLAFFLSSTRGVLHAPPAHAASTAATTLSASTSTLSKLNPFKTRTADEMIDAYVRDRLFADDVYDPVESAYREAFTDTPEGGKAAGAYPTLLAETAASALGQQQKAGASLISSSTGSAVGKSNLSGRNDGITAVLIKASDFLQSKLRVSASVSYYLIAGGGLLGICVLPGMVGVLYQGIQRWQIDKSEMKMYGKISDLDATSKRETDDDDDDDEEE